MRRIHVSDGLNIRKDEAKITMITIETLTLYGMFVPVITAMFTIAARNPIHAILWLITTFLLASGRLFHYYQRGFTCSLIVIVYVGAIAILFRFIIMMIPVKARNPFTWT